MKIWKNIRLLQIAGILELAISCIEVVLATYVLFYENSSLMIGGIYAHHMHLFSIILVYAVALFQLTAGVIALVYGNSKKNADRCMLIGIVLLFLQVLLFNKTEETFVVFFKDFISLIVPFLYLCGAAQNKKKGGNKI